MKHEGLIQPHWHQSPKQGYNESEKHQVPTKISSSSAHQSQVQQEFLRGQYKNSDHIKPEDYQSPTSSTFQTHQSPQAPPLSSVQEEIPSRSIRIPHDQVPGRKQTQFSEHYALPKLQFPEQISSQAPGKQSLEENQSLSISSLQPQFPKQDSDRKQSYGDSKSAPQPPKLIHEHPKQAPTPQNQKSDPVIPYPEASENKEKHTSDLFPKNVYRFRLPPEPPSPGPPCCMICCAACINGFKHGFKESIDAAARLKVQLETDVAEAEQQQQHVQKSQTRPFAPTCAKLKLCTKQIQISFSYVFYYKRYVKQLEHGMEMVCDIRDALGIEVAIAQCQKKSVSPVVVNWIAGVDKIEPETRRFIGEAKGRKHYLCWPMARYWLSFKCVKKREQLREIEREGKLFRKVADPAVPPPRIGSTSVRILMPDFSRLG
ncbi:hypothetical protein CCACVL1_29393 [Corchorus capsularis]|uniref:Uncharacterized protein n=1 Tax=Corchorus capsularis TaxID=210143 RepID=A0A1R3G1V9_COCAP|nr:hypothetical protein CCACVL1_29393 [Corchorus capsularis]